MIEVVGLRAEGLVEPLGLGTPAPGLSWELRSRERCQRQTAYEIEVAPTPDFSRRLWASGWREGDDQRIRYGGAALASRQRAWWRVRARDAFGDESAWSGAARFEIGLLHRSDWHAEWVTHPEWAAGDAAALPVLAADFEVGHGEGEARLFVSGLGVYVARINGQPVGDAQLEPPYSDFRRTVAYRVHDVTRLLWPGRNSIEIALGTGIAHVVQLPDRYTKLTGALARPRAIAQLEITAAGGSVTRVATGPGWRAALGPTLRSHWYGGEDHDARREPDDWRPAVVVAPPGDLVADSAPPIRVLERLAAREIGRTQDGARIFDAGINVMGWPRIELTAPAGREARLLPGELLDEDGRVSQKTTGWPIFDTYVTREGAQSWHPRFTYHGFRYLEALGLPDDATVEVLVLRAGNAPAGSFSCSNPLLEDIHRLIDRAVRSNMASTLTDCPHREKLGWLEQSHLLFDVVARGYDVAAYARRLLRMIVEAQTDAGLVPSTAPEYVVFDGAFRDDVNWGGAVIHLPWRIYLAYGDAEPLRECYPAMRRYLAYLDSRATEGILEGGLGDWFDAGPKPPPELVATWGYQRAAAVLARVAALLGEDDGPLRSRAESIAAAFQRRFFDPSGRTYGTGTQACDALALDMGVVPPEAYDDVVRHLVESIEGAGDHLTVGEVALPSLFRALSAAGRDDVLYRAATRTDAPSYGYQVAHGATSLTEAWDGPTRGLSQNHFMLGAIDDWFTRVLAGIDQCEGSAGYRRPLIHPVPVGGLTAAAATIPTPFGPLASGWRLAGDEMTLEVDVPIGAVAEVRLPDGGRRVGSGHWRFEARR